MSVVADNLETAHKKIRKTALNVRRDPADIQLIAVSKKQPDDRIDQALNAGHRLFGENRVQEATERWNERRKAYGDLKLHLIGPLQTNKTRQAVALFDCIESLDRPKLAKALAREMDEQNRKLPCFIQINTGEEDQKAGCLPADFPALLSLSRELGLHIRGLMCIPPAHEPPALHFCFLSKLAQDYGLKDLSMGMSGDYKTAIESGATHVRIGTGIFGTRART